MGGASVFRPPETTADAGSIVEEKITADSYSVCPILLLNSAQLLRIFPSARLLLKPIVAGLCRLPCILLLVLCPPKKKYYKMGEKPAVLHYALCQPQKNYNLKMLCQTVDC
jgi:hypothetical protein